RLRRRPVVETGSRGRKGVSAQTGPAVGPDRGLRPGGPARVVITAPGGREKRSRPRDGAPSGGEVTMTTTTEQRTVRPDVTCFYDDERWTIVTDGTPWGIGAGVLVVDG